MKEIGWQVIFIILLFFSCTPASKKDSEAKKDSYSVEEDIPDPALRLRDHAEAANGTWRHFAYSATTG